MEWIIPIVILVILYGLIWLDVDKDPLIGKDRSRHRQNSEDHEDLCQ